MSIATRKLHEKLIRLFKGVLRAWEEWLAETVADDEKNAAVSKPQT